jgi:hypothetical protein
MTGWRAPAFMIAAMSSSLNRRCLPMNVHGMTRAAAFILSHDSRTLSIPAACWSVELTCHSHHT